MKKTRAFLLLVTISLFMVGCQTGPLANFSKSILGEPSAAESDVSNYQTPLPTRNEIVGGANPYRNASYGLGYRRGNLPCRT